MPLSYQCCGRSPSTRRHPTGHYWSREGSCCREAGSSARPSKGRLLFLQSVAQRSQRELTTRFITRYCASHLRNSSPFSSINFLISSVCKTPTMKMNYAKLKTYALTFLARLVCDKLLQMKNTFSNIGAAGCLIGSAILCRLLLSLGISIVFWSKIKVLTHTRGEDNE